MKALWIPLFVFCSYFSYGQSVLPFDLDSMLYFHKEYKIVQWSVKSVAAMDSLHRPLFYKGTALVIPRQVEYRHDTAYVADVVGIDPKKYETFTDQPFYVPRENEEKRLIIHPFHDYISYDCVISQGVLPSIPTDKVMDLYYSVIPRGGRNFNNYVVRPEYSYEFPNGLPKKIKLITYKTYGKPYLLPLEDWETMGEEDKEGLDCHIFPEGYYSFCASTHSQSGSGKILEIQKALHKRGFPLKLTGILDSPTKAAITSFQKEHCPPMPFPCPFFELLGVEE